MRFHIVTTFPGLVEPYMRDSILLRAQKAGIIDVRFYNPRNFSDERHKKTDDTPYGGGPGMVMYAEPILKTITHVISTLGVDKYKIKFVHFSPSGKQFTNKLSKTYTKFTDIILICGRYEGIDARVKKILKGDEISVGPYVLTGGELPAAIIVDAVTRQIPGVLGNSFSLEESRTASRNVFTRPEILDWQGKKYKVPKVLLSGNHAKIEEWKKGH